MCCWPIDCQFITSCWIRCAFHLPMVAVLYQYCTTLTRQKIATVQSRSLNLSQFVSGWEFDWSAGGQWLLITQPNETCFVVCVLQFFGFVKSKVWKWFFIYGIIRGSVTSRWPVKSFEEFVLLDGWLTFHRLIQKRINLLFVWLTFYFHLTIYLKNLLVITLETVTATVMTSFTTQFKLN